MDNRGTGERADRDLVVVALPGVQRFIAEARSTADVSSASEIYAALADRACAVLAAAGGELVLPSGSVAGPSPGQYSAPMPGQNARDGMPNRVVALFPAGSGAVAARRAREALEEEWRGWIRQVFRLGSRDLLPETPGFPPAQWVSVPAVTGGYADQWRQAHRLLAARRRVRDFPAMPDEGWRKRALCSLAPRWPAEPTAPQGVPPHERHARLSVVGWVKRRWRHMEDSEGFPSTASIASAPYRHSVLQHLDDPTVGGAVRDLFDAARRVRDAAPGAAGQEAIVPGLHSVRADRDPGRWFAISGGPWVYPERWRAETLAREAAPDRETQANLEQAIRPAADIGRAAARRLGQGMDDIRRRQEKGDPLPPPLASHLAVIVQDLDNMGRFLGGDVGDAAGRRISVNPAEHERVSRTLQEVAAAQWAALEAADLLGVPIYAGGDDLLAFTPARTALAAAERCHGRADTLPHASTAVLFFHYHASLQQALREARELLETAKQRVHDKHALAVGYLRRSGVSAASVQPWTGRAGCSSAELFMIFGRHQAQRLSPRLVADLDRDADELARLSAASLELYRAELLRLIRRHSGRGAGGDRDAAVRAAGALEWLGRHEHARQPAGPPAVAPEFAARVGVFLRQEAR